MADTSKELLNKITVAPDQSGYSHSFGDDTVDAKYGVLGDYRRGVFNNAMPFDVSWIADGVEYKYLVACYRAFIASGGVPFLIDLVADEYRLTEHKAIFERGSFRLNRVQEETYFVSAQLWAEPAVQYDVATRPFVTDQSLSDLRLSAGTGVFNAILQNAGSHITGRSFQAGSGSFALTGQSVNLNKNRSLSAGSGSFTLSGQSVELTAP